MLTKVRNLNVKIVVQKEILRFQIAMNDHVTMTVVDAGYDLLEESSGLVFLQLPMLYNVVEELAAGHVLHYHEYIRRRAYHLIPEQKLSFGAIAN